MNTSAHPTRLLSGSLLLIILTTSLLTGCPRESFDQEDASVDESNHATSDTNQDSSDSDEDIFAPDDFGPWPAPRPGCNGHPELCARQFHEIVFPGTHNSMSNAEDGWGAPNQNLPLRQQLIDGIRVFLLDIYEEDGDILLCHAFCGLGSRPLLDAMGEFRSFLRANPSEVITLIFEDYIPAARTAEILEEAGLIELVYTHPEEGSWPALGEMIAADTRLVITAERAGPPPPWLHHIWEIAWDSPYSFSSIDQFNCNHNRGDQNQDLFLLNHWVLNPLPSPRSASETNSYEVLMERVEACQQQWDRLPTFLAIDFHDIGDLFEVVDVLNALREPR